MYSSDLMKYETKGTGVIIVWEGKFLFVVGKKEYWNTTKSPIEITYTNTGGHVDPGETVLDATKREVREELGCDINLLSSSTSFYCELGSSKIDKYHLEDEIAPIIMYNSSEMKMSVCVYLAYISQKPCPSAEVPAILLLPVAFLGGGHLSELLHQGVILIEQKEGIIPKNSYFRPFGSAQILADHWDRFSKIKDFMNLIE